jgi:cysteine desulfurase
VKRVYVDHAATTPMLAEARAAWLANAEAGGNASSLHTSGRRARQIVEEAREQIAGALGVRPSAVLFTSGGTEADNLAIKGITWAQPAPRRVIASAVEHHAVLDPVQWLGEHEDVQIDWLRVDALGRVELDHLEELLAAGPASLCTVMWANNEVGTVQPVHAIAQMCRDAHVPFHTDAVQALGQVPMDLRGIDATTIASHKIGGPFGIGALIADPSIELMPIMHGGGQERDVRSGTFDPPAAAAFAVAVDHAVTKQAEHAVQMQTLQEALRLGIGERIPDAVFNGDLLDRLPGNVHVSFPGCEGDALLMLLDAAGIDCSTGSACTAGIPEPSHVLVAMGIDDRNARGSLRFSFGRASTLADVDAILAVLPDVVERARRAGSVSTS